MNEQRKEDRETDVEEQVVPPGCVGRAGADDPISENYRGVRFFRVESEKGAD